MQGTKSHAQHFSRLQQMSYICPRVIPAGRAVTALLDGPHILLKFLIEQVQLPELRIYMSMASVAAGIYAVKEIYAPVYSLYDIEGSPYSHKIGRLSLRQMGHHLVQHAIHLLMALSHCESAHCISVQLHLRDDIRMPYPYVMQYAPLIDTE